MFNVMINLIEVLAQRVFSSQSLGVNSRHCRMEQDNANERLEQRLRLGKVQLVDAQVLQVAGRATRIVLCSIIGTISSKYESSTMKI
jgi:predicted kinase